MSGIECGDLLIGNTNDVQIVGLQNNDDDSFINDATCVLELLDSSGNGVSGATNISMDYVAGSDGNYEGAIPHSVSLTEDAEYTIHVTATKEGAGVGDWRCVKRAKYRKCGP